MPNRNLTACFTGHRPNKLGGYDESNAIMLDVKDRLDRAIDYAVDSLGITTFISGMALGVDMAAAELVLKWREQSPRLGIRLIAAVPFEGQERMWPGTSQDRWFDILAQADEVTYVCEPGYATWKMQKRNAWMVDNSSLVIAVWDGTRGGTGNCVEYARKAEHKPRIIRIDPLKDGRL
ncbi:SLOG family protein [Paenibacillus sp. FSL W8-0426]|uniref:SLOG family protein n=1 Tax=Paenibacillus sp. FSL W8-0426 TaxID=2921714 RepID=UPI0030D7B4A6